MQTPPKDLVSFFVPRIENTPLNSLMKTSRIARQCSIIGHENDSERLLGVLEKAKIGIGNAVPYILSLFMLDNLDLVVAECG
jgi:hypothetical protein